MTQVEKLAYLLFRGRGGEQQPFAEVIRVRQDDEKGIELFARPKVSEDILMFRIIDILFAERSLKQAVDPKASCHISKAFFLDKAAKTREDGVLFGWNFFFYAGAGTMTQVIQHLESVFGAIPQAAPLQRQVEVPQRNVQSRTPQPRKAPITSVGAQGAPQPGRDILEIPLPRSADVGFDESTGKGARALSAKPLRR